MPPDFFSCDYFSLFDLPIAAELDVDVLQQKYQQLQSAAHPDKFAGGAASERRLAEQMAARINDAYQTLRQPLRRCAYILSLQDITVFAEDNTAMPADFLMQQIEWREELEDADEAQKKVLLFDIAAVLADIISATTTALQNADWQLATDKVRQWKYLEKMLAEHKGVA